MNVPRGMGRGSGASLVGAMLILSGGVAPLSGATAQLSSDSSWTERRTSGRAVDGDTLSLRGGVRVRVIGIDAPERGECGYNEAKSATRRFIARGFTLKRPASVADKDRYGRQLRYVQGSSGDLGTYLLRRGLVEARYDSVDGYSRHPRQRAYRKLDRSVASSCADNADGPVSTPTRKPVPVYTPPPSPAPVYAPQPAPTPTPTYTPPAPTYTPPAPSVYYRNCDAARAAGAAPVYRGQPGYGSHLDRDGDGIGCE